MQFLQKYRVPIGFALALLFIAINTIISYRSVNLVITNNARVTHTYKVIDELQRLLSTLQDVETGQRGYIITGEEVYLWPHNEAVGHVEMHFERLQKLVDPQGSGRYLAQLKEFAHGRIATSQETVARRREGDIAGARTLIMSGRGKRQMNKVRELIDTMKTVETKLLDERNRESAQSSRDARLTLALAALVNLALLGLVYYMIARDLATRRESEARLRERAKQLQQSADELRHSEARKSSILQSALDCVISMDHTYRIIEWNPAAEKTFGYTRDEVMGKDLPDLIIPEPLRAAHRAGMEKYLATGQSVVLNQRIEVTAIRRNGEEFPIELAVTRIEGEGNPLFTAYLRDITGRKQSELDLQRARDNAETANKTKSLFLANMSHELRTPLNAILGYSEMLQEEAEEDGLDQFTPDLEKINTAGKHLLTLINDILDLSKIEAGKMELYLEEFDVADIVNDLTATVRPLVEQNENTLRVKCDDNLGEMRSDLTKVRQSLLNLLSNAAKFTHKGDIVLEAKREHMDGRDWITLLVRDSGIGMSNEQLVKLFRPFTQADASTTRKFGGTGLGLALTRRFCQMMGGDVTVSSRPGEGSVFTIKIPAITEAVGDVKEEIESDLLGEVLARRAAPQFQSTPGAGSTPEPTPAEEAVQVGENPEPISYEPGTAVLVIDDDADQRELMRRFLTREGFLVATAAGGEEGLELARQIRPLAITLDVMMPDMDGWSVLTALKNDAELQEIPVIMLTMVDDKNRGYTLGAADYLTKPIDRERLGRLLQKYRCAEPPCPVLVVEDDDTMRGMISKMLTSAGWHVSQAANGREALLKVEENLPALILLDLMMPEMDGFEFASTLRRHQAWRNIPVIVLTAKELTSEDRLKLNGYVQKVLQKTAHSREELLQQVRDLISSYQAT